MKENDALRPVLQRKQHSIPFAIRFWCFFKKNVLEDPSTRELYASHDPSLSEEQFRESIRPLLKEKGPKCARGQSSSAAFYHRVGFDALYQYYVETLSPQSLIVVKETDDGRGLGLFLKRDVSHVELANWIRGYVVKLWPADYELIVDREYPSLFAGESILFGTLSLVNHSCDARSPIFGNPTKHVHDAFEGLQGIRLQFKCARNYICGEEIVVNYRCDNNGFNCLCQTCQQLL
jgi:hypothetical protein